jgi:hypothetical protein
MKQSSLKIQFRIGLRNTGSICKHISSWDVESMGHACRSSPDKIGLPTLLGGMCGGNHKEKRRLPPPTAT